MNIELGEKDTRGFGGRKLKFQHTKKNHRSPCGCCINNTRKSELVIKYKRRLVQEQLTAVLHSYSPSCA